jgi:ubiquinone/menaquinone biosynthesis C-methylase UbiE
MSTNDPTYALGRTDFEHQRLLDQARVVRPLTERLFRAAGIGPGMRVLDVGSGMGDVAFLAAELVGPGGEVVGVDVDGAALDKARSRAELLGHANIRFVHGDLRTADLGGVFDAAAGRLVLLYLADPADGLRSVASRVRRGGAIVFQEMDMADANSPMTYPPIDSLWSATGAAIVKTFAAAGVHTRMGRRLLETYHAAGLPLPVLIQDAMVGGGPDFPAYAWLANTLRSLAPLAEKLGVAKTSELGLDTLAARIRDDAVAKNLMVWSPTFVGAFSTKP